MTAETSNEALSTTIAAELPYLRRYARALTGSQDSGDRYAMATLETIVEDPGLLKGAGHAKIALFKVFHGIWTSSGALVDASGDSDDTLENRAQDRLRTLTPNTREALLLHSVEGFSADEVAAIMGLERAEADHLHEVAMADMASMVSGNILIIEDEAIIAMDLHSIVSTMGHTVTDIARTRDAAIRLGKAKVPDLILADIQLADKSSGVDAVNALLAELGERPVIFITAFPERLLTGERPEPAFLITKPYSEEQVRAAVSQAMFFSSTESLLAAS